jgi:protoporphyrin/coproporphyrin ferrochelatase
MTSAETGATAILLLNLGGPDDLASVEPFLVNLFSDREIIELPGGALLQPALARVIAKLRGPSVRRNYRLIGGGSPQLEITRRQAAALEERLNAGAPDLRFRVFVAMRYSRPSSDDALAAIAAAGIRRIVTLTLFPHYSKATTGSSIRELERVLSKPRWRSLDFDVTHIDRYPDHPKYIDAMSRTVLEGWAAIPPPRRNRAVLLFSAHGLPQRFIDRGDPYADQIEMTRRSILERVKLPNRQLLAYQSRTGPVRWLGPGTEEVLRELGDDGVQDVLVIPLSFVSDHIETLYEVDLLFADIAAHAGIAGYRRIRALNDSPLFIAALAGLVRDHLAASSRPTCGGCCHPGAPTCVRSHEAPRVSA